MKAFLRSFLGKAKSLLSITLPDGRKMEPVFRPSSLLPLLASLIAFLFFAFEGGIGEFAVAFPMELYVMEAFMAIVGVLGILLFVDMCYRPKTSHILLVALSSLSVFLFSLTLTIALFLKGGVPTGSILYLISSITSLAAFFFDVRKAIEGDIDWRYRLANGLNLLFLFFAVCFTYPVLEMFSHFDDWVFWLSLYGGLTILIFSAVVMAISSASDYDPNPAEIDELGNVIEKNPAK